MSKHSIRVVSWWCVVFSVACGAADEVEIDSAVSAEESAVVTRSYDDVRSVIDGYESHVQSDVMTRLGHWFTCLGDSTCNMPSAYDGTFTLNSGSTTVGADAIAFTFYGTSAKYFACKSASFGKVRVFIDDVLKGTLDLYASATSCDQLIYDSGALTAGFHTIKIDNAGAKATAATSHYVSLDRFEVTEADGPSVCFSPLGGTIRTPAYRDSNSPIDVLPDGSVQMFNSHMRTQRRVASDLAGVLTNPWLCVGGAAPGAACTSDAECGAGGLCGPDPSGHSEASVSGPAIDRWIEATYRPSASQSTLYAWYHYEQNRAQTINTQPCGVFGAGCQTAVDAACTGRAGWSSLMEEAGQPAQGLTSPKVGMLKSTDNGQSWADLGVVLSAPTTDWRCNAANGDFGSGNGDPGVVVKQGEPSNGYAYIYYGNYGGTLAQQGISVARVALSDLDSPVGKAAKWVSGATWTAPGIGGVGGVIPNLKATRDWRTTGLDAFWGPQIHYNTALGMYVMLLNRTSPVGSTPPLAMFGQEGVYISFSVDPAVPTSWTRPVKLPSFSLMFQGGQAAPLGWYPMVIGVGPGETDKKLGSMGFLFTKENAIAAARFYTGTANRPSECQ